MRLALLRAGSITTKITKGAKLLVLMKAGVWW